MPSLTHTFESEKADGVDATKVQPSNWNAEHTHTCATLKILGRRSADTGAVEELSATEFMLNLIEDMDTLVELQTFLGIVTVAGYVPSTRTISTTGLLTGGGDLSVNRTFDLPKATVPECEAGVNDIHAVTPLGLAAGIAALTSAGSLIAVGIHTASGTWTKAVGVQSVLVLAQGGGGSGGTVVDPAVSTTGGGAGGFALEFIDVTAIASVAVTIGAGGAAVAGGGTVAGNVGGTTSFGAHLTCLGGLGGNVTGAAALGGAASAGGLNIRGASSPTTTLATPTGSPGGTGASGVFGGGGIASATAPSRDGDVNSGAGGAGGVPAGAGAAGSSGAGGSGWVVVLSFS